MKVNHIKLHESGIYNIINIQNNKTYIGSSKSLRKRLMSHRWDLNKNRHSNAKLQYSWNKHTKDNFICSILEYCSFEKLQEREQFFIDNLKPEYNICLKVGKYEIKQSNSIDKVYKYSLQGDYISEYDDIINASKENNIALSSIYRCINGIYKKGGNFIWSTNREIKIKPYIKLKKDNSFMNKKVQVLNINTNKLYKEFNSIKECAIYFNTYQSSISNAIKVKQKFKKKYIIIKK